MLKPWFRRCAALWRPSRVRDEITEELQFHIDQCIEANLRKGLPAAAARREAIRRFGPALQIAEQGYDVRGLRWADALLSDVRYALRLLLKHKGFTAIAVVTLGLGVGTTTAIFSVMHAILMRPLPYAQPDRIVVLQQRMARAGVDELLFSVEEIRDYRRYMSTLSEVAEYHTDRFVVVDGSTTERVRAGVVSHDFFDLFGVSPVLGRSFSERDERPDAAPVAVLSYRYWMQRYQGDRTVIGRTLRTDARLITVVGVLPRIPQYPDENDIYITTTSSAFRMWPERVGNRNRRFLRAFARLKPGIAPAEASGEAALVARRLQYQYPDSYPIESGYSAATVRLSDEVTRRVRPTIWLLSAASAFVLLIACANVTNFTLARSTHREREWLLRFALGASRSRVLGQLATESALVAVLTATVALLLAVVSQPLLINVAGRLTARADDIAMNRWVLIFGVITAAVASAIAGSTPLLFVADRASISRAGHRATGGVAQTLMRSALVAAQVAFAVALLAAAGLMIRSIQNLEHVDGGVSDAAVLTMHLDFAASRYRTPADQRAAGRAIVDEVRHLPGVVAAADSSSFPLDPEAIDLGLNYLTNRFRVENVAIPAGQPLPWVPIRLISTDYFRTLQIPLIEGRTFVPADDAAHPPVVVVNRAFAEHRLAGDPVGQRITRDGTEWLPIVGVVGNTKEYSLTEASTDEVYFALEQVPSNPSTSWSVGSLLIRADIDPLSLENQVRGIIDKTAPEIAVSRVRTLSDARRATLAPPLLTTTLLTAFAALALTVAALGIAAMMVLSVAQRIKELGVRLALGAQPAALVRMVVTEGMKPVIIGLVAGVAVAAASMRPLRGFLFEVAPGDWTTTLAIAALMAATALTACYCAARRVARISPVTALGNE